MTTLRIPFGLERLPRSLSPDDPRLPGVAVGGAMLRLNSEPLPPEAMEAGAGDHAARLAAMRRYLHGLCGDYAPQRVRFIDCYLDAVSAHIAAHRDELASALRTYDGLYVPEDWLWSAPRPLPRAWLRAAAGMVPAEVVFWDGTQAIAIDLGIGTPAATGFMRCRITQAQLAGDPLSLLETLPATFRWFWRGETLPRSPFRRAIPSGVLDSNVLGVGELTG